MKKAVILTLMYAILFSMAVGSFSLYTASVPIASTVFYPDTAKIILNDPSCYVNATITKNQNKNTAKSYYRGQVTSPSAYISSSGKIRIYMIKEGTGSTYTYVADYVNAYGITTNIQTITNISAYSPPHAVVLEFSNFDGYSIIISSTNFNQPSPETGTFDKTIISEYETILLEPIFIDANNCFDVTFSFDADGNFHAGNASFSIYVG